MRRLKGSTFHFCRKSCTKHCSVRSRERWRGPWVRSPNQQLLYDPWWSSIHTSVNSDWALLFDDSRQWMDHRGKISSRTARHPRRFPTKKELEKPDGGLPWLCCETNTQRYWSYFAISSGRRGNSSVWKAWKGWPEKNANGDLCQSSNTRTRLEDLGLSRRWYKSCLQGIKRYSISLNRLLKRDAGKLTCTFSYGRHPSRYLSKYNYIIYRFSQG